MGFDEVTEDDRNRLTQEGVGSAFGFSDLCTADVCGGWLESERVILGDER